MKRSSSRLPNTPRSPASLWAGMISCLVCLWILSALIRNAWADADGLSERMSAKAPPAHALKIVEVDSGRPKLTMIDGDSRRVVEVPQKAKVRLNGAPAAVEEITPGDSVTFEVDDEGNVTGVNATRLQTGIVFNTAGGEIEITTDYTDKHPFKLADDVEILLNGQPSTLGDLHRGDQAQISPDRAGLARKIDVTRHSLVAQFWENFRHNLFKPLLLFFYMGFSVPLLKIAFEFPHVIYQGLTIYLLVSIGWHGGEELAELSGGVLRQAVMFMAVGFCTNFVIGILAVRHPAEVHPGDAARRCGDGFGLLRVRLGRDVRDVPGRAGRRQHQIRRLHARHAGGDGNPGLPGGALPRVASPRLGDGRSGEHAR